MYPIWVGLLLGFLQTGFFFQLTFTLSSGFNTYLMVTLCWLAGSILGAAVLWKTAIPLRSLLFIGMGAYGLCALILVLAPFNSRLWILYALLVFLNGVYPGVFFSRMSRIYPLSSLFFRENNGFLLGLLGATLAFMILGRAALWGAPLLLSMVVLILPEPNAA